MKKTTTIRVTQTTESQIKELSQAFGCKSDVIAIAIDRLYQQEANK